MLGRQAYFAALFVVFGLITWDATVRGRSSTQPARPTSAHELSCDLTKPGSRSLQLLGKLPEASGLTLSRRSPNLLWSMNDSDDPIVIALSTTGEVKGQVRVTGAAVRDWEALAVGPCPGGSCLYVADIGDDGAKRMQVTV